MAEETFDYPRILQRALRSVVREVLLRTADDGLPGEHHFYLSLRASACVFPRPTPRRARWRAGDRG